MKQIEFSSEEVEAMKQEMFRGFTDAQVTLCLEECRRRNLVPGQHIHFSLRNTKEYDPVLKTSAFIKKIVRVTTIDAMRLIAQRTGEYEGQGTAIFYYLDSDGEPTLQSKIPLPSKEVAGAPREPWAASIPIYRKGLREPVEVVARFDAYAQLRKTDNGMVLTEVWQKRAPEMCLKCSCVAALRAAFPEELGSLYLREELDEEEASKPLVPSEPVALVAAPAALVVPVVNSAPVEGTAEARPNEAKVAMEFVAGSPPTKEQRKRVIAKEEPKAAEPIVEETIQKMDDDPLSELPPESEPLASLPEESQAVADEMFGNSATAEPDRLPTPEEWKATADELRTYTKIDRTNLKNFCLRDAGLAPTAEIKAITKQAWDRILLKLKQAQADKILGKTDAFDKLFF